MKAVEMHPALTNNEIMDSMGCGRQGNCDW